VDTLKYLAVTKQEAELILDSFKVSNPITRDLALKAAGLVLEFAAEDGITEAERLAVLKPKRAPNEDVRLEAQGQG
jgi:hypothetical protein